MSIRTPSSRYPSCSPEYYFPAKTQPDLKHQLYQIQKKYPNCLLYSILTLIVITATALAIFSFITLLNSGSNRPSSESIVSNNLPQSNVILVTITSYATTQETRFQLALKTIQAAHKMNFNIIVMDASVVMFGNDKGSLLLQEAGAHVFPTPDANCLKGCALRLAIKKGLELDTGNKLDKVIVFLEPEKVDFIRFVPHLAFPIQSNTADLVLPKRCYDCFNSLPVEQEHEERFGNYYLNVLLKSLNLEGWPEDIDWYFGPVLIHSRLAPFYLQSNLAMWEAQVVPYVQAYHYYRNKWLQDQSNPLLRVKSMEIGYRHPSVQKAAEEGDITFVKKRLKQLNLLIEVVGNSLKDSHVQLAQENH